MIWVLFFEGVVCPGGGWVVGLGGPDLSPVLELGMGRGEGGWGQRRVLGDAIWFCRMLTTAARC